MELIVRCEKVGIFIFKACLFLHKYSRLHISILKNTEKDSTHNKEEFNSEGQHAR